MSAMKDSSGSSLELLDESSSSFWLAAAAFMRSRVGLPGAGWYSSSANVFWSSSSSSKYLHNPQTTCKHLALAWHGEIGRNRCGLTMGSNSHGILTQLSVMGKLLEWFPPVHCLGAVPTCVAVSSFFIKSPSFPCSKTESLMLRGTGILQAICPSG